ncbi:MAG: hypothetical protein II937_01035 [Bacteroidales bacterium]|nr:hypothetical protein [Bacteroidales bacterium]
MSIRLPSDFCFTKVIYKKDQSSDVNKFDDEVTTPLKQWISFLKTGEIPDAFTAQGLKEAREVLRVDSLSEEDRKIYKRYLEGLSLAMSLDDSSRYEGYYDGFGAGREEGRAEGRAEGIEQGRTEQLVESTKNLMSAGFDFDKAVETLKAPADQIPELRHLIFNN